MQVTIKQLAWRAAPVILLFLLTVVFLYPVVLGGRALLPADYLSSMRPWNADTVSEHAVQWNPLMWDGIAQFYPWRLHYSRSMISGEIPLWNPYQFCGTPFTANAQTAVFYPPNLLFVLFAPVTAFGISAFIHLFLAGAFTFLLARALGVGRFGATVAGITFEFSAFMVVWLELPTLVNVAAWLPLVFYLILRSLDRTGPIHAIFAGLALGVSILGGHFQIASYVVGAALLWWIWLVMSRARTYGWTELSRGAGLALLTFAVAFLIAAPQILPTFELAGLSHRVRDISAEGYARYIGNAAPVRRLITLFIPNFYGNPAMNTYWDGSAANFMEYSFYIGLLPLILALIGGILAIRWRTVGFFVTLALLSLLLAFGAPINYIIYHLPGTSALGGPNRVIVLFCFAASMLAGFGAHWFVQRAQQEYLATRRRYGWRALTITAAAFIIVFTGAQVIAITSLGELGIESSKVFASVFDQYISFGALLVAGLAVLALYTAGLLPRAVFAGLAIAVIVGDLFSFGMGFNPTAQPGKVYPETTLTRWIRDNVGSTRIMPINRKWSLYQAPDAILPPNAGTVYQFYDMQGYDSLFSREYKQFVDNHLKMDSSPQENGNMLLIRKYVPDWPEGTAGYVLSKDPIPGLKKVFSSDGVDVYQKTPYLSVYLQPQGSPSSTQSIGESNIMGLSANTVIATSDADQSARMVLAQTWYPGWTAEVDGVRKPITADGIFRSVAIEPGDSTVTFRFQPGSYVVGAFLGLLGIAAVGVAAGMFVARKRL